MRVAVVAVVAVVVWFWPRLASGPLPSPAPALPYLVVLLAGLLAGFTVGRRVGHRDAGAGLLGLWVRRRLLGRAG